jgi:putative protease
VPLFDRVGLHRVDVRCFGHAGGPLKTVWSCGEIEVTVRGEVPLSPASKRALDMTLLREQFGRLGGTPFKLGAVEITGLAAGLFIPVSELNRLRQEATEQIEQQLGWARMSDVAVREARIDECVARVPVTTSNSVGEASAFALRAVVYDLETAREAAAGGATDIVLDPFLRHPTPPLARVTALRDELAAQGISLRLRTPTIVRPEERGRLAKWFGLGLPLLTGHLGLAAEFGRDGHDVIADYATNVFNQHTAALLFELGATRVVASIELTTDELSQLVAPWDGRGFEVLVYGRTEGMTIEHCVLSAAFEREPTTCRDLCVQKHTNVSLTDPAGYTFAVATDSNCRNRLLHSRPIDATEFLPTLWAQGIRGYQMVFNVPGDPVQALVRAYRETLDALAVGGSPDLHGARKLLAGAFTRGHFARAV